MMHFVVNSASKFYLHDDQDIQRVIILAESSRDETIVVGVHNWRIQHTVDLHDLHQ